MSTLARGLSTLLLVLLAEYAVSQTRFTPSATLLDFLSCRQANGISGVTPSSTLASLTEATPVELKGASKGRVVVGSESRYLFEGSGGTWVATAVPEHLESFARRGAGGRFIVKASQTQVGLQAEILSAVREIEIANYDERIAFMQGIPVKGTSNPLDSIETQTAPPDEVTARYADFVLRSNSELEVAAANLVAEALIRVGTHFKLDARLLAAVCVVVSAFDRNYVSASGRLGIACLPAAGCIDYGLTDAFDVYQNLWAAGKSLKAAILEFTADAKPNLSLALAAFRDGVDAVRSAGGVPEHQVTRDFVEQAIASYKKLCGTTS